MRFYGIFLIVLVLAFAPLARGQTLEVLHSFQAFNGRNPTSELVQGNDGFFYGTTLRGGANDQGTVFKMTPSGTVTTLVSFNSTNGGLPDSPLLQGNDGNFYSTTFGGGANGNYGTVFKITTNGSLTTLLSFNSTNGANPTAGLCLGDDGNFYGTTANGGSNNLGAAFRISSNGAFLSLNSFFLFYIDPRAELIQGRFDKIFYGTTRQGGANNNHGAVIKLTTNGTLTALRSFDGANGSGPRGKLIQFEGDNFGDLYGTTYSGGSSNLGTVFKVTTHPIMPGVITTLHSFKGTNGAYPEAGLVQANDGAFYGTTSMSGTNSGGTIFKITTNGVLTTLISCKTTNGTNPRAGLIQANDGNLYGTTSAGGKSGHGTVYRLLMRVTLNSLMSGDQLVLSWPTNAVGFTLQAAADLNSPTNWIDFTNAPGVVGGQFTITNPVSGEAQFYRLRKP